MQKVHTMHQLKVELQNVRMRLGEAAARKDVAYVTSAISHLDEVDRLLAVLERIDSSE